MTDCSIGPNSEWLPPSGMSFLIVSPNSMKGLSATPSVHEAEDTLSLLPIDDADVKDFRDVAPRPFIEIRLKFD